MSNNRKIWHLWRAELESLGSLICNNQFELKVNTAAGEFMNRNKFIYYIDSSLIESGMDLFLFLFLTILIFRRHSVIRDTWDAGEGNLFFYLHVLIYCDNYLWVLFIFLIESTNITDDYILWSIIFEQYK